MYGSRVDSEGKAIQGDSAFVAPETGERVQGNTIASIGLAKDKEGNTVETRATIEFQQASGAKVRWTLFEPQEGEGNEWQKTALERNVKHMATKVMTEDEYHSAMEAGTPAEDFQSFISKLAQIILPAAAGKVFTMKFVYNNGYVTVPKFPNWITTPDNENTLSTNARYDKYEAEAPSEAPAAGTANSNVF
jgi:hypothetical protein